VTTGNKPTSFIRGREYFQQLEGRKLLKKDFAPLTYTIIGISLLYLSNNPQYWPLQMSIFNPYPANVENRTSS